MKKNWIKMTAALGLTFIVVAGAWKMPEIVYSFSDSRNQHQQEDFQFELKQFAKEGSLEEHLYSFALCDGYDNDYTMRAVKMQEATQAGSDEELTEIIQSELQKLGGVLEEFNKVLPQDMGPQDMVSRELYTAYVTSAKEGVSRESITFWKVKYQWADNEEKQYELEVILDMEYHKIYNVRLAGSEVENLCMFYRQMNEEKYKEITKAEQHWEFITQIRSYYGDIAARYNVGLEIGDTYEYDAAQESVMVSKAEVEELTDEIRFADIVHQLKGAFIYYDEENGIVQELDFVKEFVIMDTGECYMQIGIANLEAILQI